MIRPAFGVLIFTAALTSHAKVTATDANSFTSEHVLDIEAAPTEVYRALTQQVADWWDAAHSYSGDAANFRLDAEPGGCFCELFNGGGVEHMRVAIARPPTQLRLVGGLGPLQGLAASGAMDFELTATAAGSRLTYRYVVSGHGVGELAQMVDQVQLGQIQRLVSFVETGAVATAPDG